MSTTLILIPSILALVLAVILAVSWLEERSRRRDREIVRRFHRYMAQLPPARPW